MVRPDVGRLSRVAAVALTTALALASVRTVLVGGEVAGWDHSFHFTNAYLTYFFFLADGHPLGYDAWHMFGWPPNLYYNPGTTLLVAFTHRLLSPFLDMKSTYSLCVALSYALMAPAAAALVHALSGSWLASLTAALITVAVFDQENSWTDAGWRQVYYIGMWPQRWGLTTGYASLALLAYAVSRRGLSTPALLASSALLMAWSTLSHAMMGIATAIFALLLAAFEAAKHVATGGSRRAAEVAVLTLLWLLWSLALLAFWAVPLLETNREYHGLRTLTWELGPGVVSTILTSYPPHFNLLALASPLLSLAKRGKGFMLGLTAYAAWAALTVAAVLAALTSAEWMGTLTLLSLALAAFLRASSEGWPALTLLPASALLMLWLATGPRTYVVYLLGLRVSFANLPIVEWFGYGKFAGYARYLLLMSSSAAAASILLQAAEWVRGRGSDDRQVAALALGSLIVAGLYLPALFAQVKNTDLLSQKRFKFVEEFPLYGNVTRFIDALSKLGLSGNTYLLVQDLSDNFADWVTFCHNHFVYEFPLYLGIPIVGGIVWTRYVTQPISTTEYSRLFTVDNGYWARELGEFYSQLRELGISYVAVFDPGLREALRSSPLFEELLSEPPYSLFRTKDSHPIISVEGGTVEDVIIRPNLMRFKLRAEPLQEYEVRIRAVLFPGLTVSASPEPALITVSKYNPRVAEATSRVWGYSVGSKIPFIRLTIVPLHRETVVEVRYRAGSWGDHISLAAISAALAALALPLLARLPLPQRFRWTSL